MRSSRIKDVLKRYITDHFECTIRTILAVHKIVEKKLKNEKSYLYTYKKKLIRNSIFASTPFTDFQLQLIPSMSF